MRAARPIAALLALLTWATLLLQLWLSVSAHLPDVFLNFFSFFTVLSNLLVALILTGTALTGTALIGTTLTGTTLSRSPLTPTVPTPLPSPSLQAATAVYIAVVGLGFSLLLRHLVELTGYNILTNALLHDVLPLLYVLFWLVFLRPRQRLPWRDAGLWLLWPAVYISYTLIRGALTGWYPYPFLNAQTLGYPRVALIVAALCLAFILLGLATIALTRRPRSPH